MPRRGRTARIRAGNAACAREQKSMQEQKEVFKSELSALQFAFAVIVNGASFVTTERVFLDNNILPPCKTSFYSHVGRVCDAIISLAQEAARQWRTKMTAGAVISIDGCWDHRRNGRYCIVAAIEQQLREVVAVGVCQRSTLGHKTWWETSPQNMEAMCVQQILTELKDNPCIVAYCHDNDAKIRSLIRRLCPHWEERLDPNHTVKSFTRLFQVYNKECDGKLASLEASLQKFMYFLIDFPIRPTQKVELWRNTINHFSGDHSKCLPHRPSKTTWAYANDRGARAALTKFLAQSSVIIERCVPLSTQLNECLHSIKSHIMSKELAWRATAFARLYLSILIFNSVPNWQERLRISLRLPSLSPGVRCRLRAIEMIRRAQNGRRATASFKEREKRRRSREKQVIGHQDKSLYVGKPREDPMH